MTRPAESSKNLTSFLNNNLQTIQEQPGNPSFNVPAPHLIPIERTQNQNLENVMRIVEEVSDIPNRTERSNQFGQTDLQNFNNIVHQLNNKQSIMVTEPQIVKEEERIMLDSPELKEEGDHMFIKSVESNTEVTHKIDARGSRIGRHSTNEIVIFDESVSRFHANISYSNGSFHLKDVKSTTGTFVKIEKPIQLERDMILEIGSYQMIVSEIYIEQEGDFDTKNTESFIVLEIYESPDEVNFRSFRLNDNSSIGRKTSNFVCFNEDPHMSNLHCKVLLIGESFIYYLKWIILWLAIPAEFILL